LTDFGRHRERDVEPIRAVVAAGMVAAATVVVPSAATASGRPANPPVAVVVAGRTLGPGWSPFVTQAPHKPAVAVETATDGRLGEAYFTFPTARDATAFEANPPALAVAQARGIHPSAYTLAGQDGFTSQNLNKESTVYTFKGGVAIFLQQGTTVVVGTYLGAPPAHRAGYNLLSNGLSKATRSAAAFLTTRPVSTTTS